MSRFTNEQLTFARTKSAYMGREESIEFLRMMDIKHSVGHWSAGDFCDRFAPPGYHSDDPSFGSDFEAQCCLPLACLQQVLFERQFFFFQFKPEDGLFILDAQVFGLQASNFGVLRFFVAEDGDLVVLLGSGRAPGE